MSGDEKIKVKTVRLIKSSVEEMTEGVYTKTAVNIRQSEKFELESKYQASYANFFHVYK